MTTKDLLNIDYREEKNKFIIQKALLKIKPLSKFSDEEYVPIEAIEKMIHLICSKYKVWIKDITLDSQSNEMYDIFRCNVIDESNLEYIETIYGICTYELFAKIVILLWSKKDKLNRR